jgi:hypothetical protein
VNQVWPLENSFARESTKLNIIFFEGNVGERKFMSFKDTWMQRGNSGVCWRYSCSIAEIPHIRLFEARRHCD